MVFIFSNYCYICIVFGGTLIKLFKSFSRKAASTVSTLKGFFYFMKLIPLGKSGKFEQVDDEDYDYLMQWNWHTMKGSRTYYAVRAKCINYVYTQYIMHRVIMGCSKGDGKVLDHIDGNGYNCQKHNLRFCTRGENNRNRRSANGTSSKYLGVHRHMDRVWIASIRVNRKLKHLGCFQNEEDAALRYNEAAKMYHGTFARINIIPTQPVAVKREESPMLVPQLYFPQPSPPLF